VFLWTRIGMVFVKDVVPRNVAPKNVVPKNVVPRNVAPKNVVPKNVVPRNVAPRNVAPKNVVPKNVVPKNVAFENVAFENVVPSIVNLKALLNFADSIRVSFTSFPTIIHHPNFNHSFLLNLPLFLASRNGLKNCSKCLQRSPNTNRKEISKKVLSLLVASRTIKSCVS
jgi:hypothetical protein